MTDFEYCIDGKPAITMLTTVLTTVYYGLLRFTTVLYPRYHTLPLAPHGPPLTWPVGHERQNMAVLTTDSLRHDYG